MLLGNISHVYTTEGLSLYIDGESSPTTKKYHFLASYIPNAGDRVLIEEVGDSLIVLGKITNDSSDAGHVAYADAAGTAATAGSAGSATKDGSGYTIATHYFASCSVTNSTITFKDGNGNNFNPVTLNRPVVANSVWDRYQTNNNNNNAICFQSNASWNKFYIAHIGGNWHEISLAS